MVSTNDGFEIANFDLQLRGPGDIQGTQQSGMLDLHVADLAKDEKLVAYTRNLAMEVLEKDPLLEKAENRRLREKVAEMARGEVDWSVIS